MKTFVLLHGFTGAPRSFDALVERLPAGARIVRPMLPGHGPSPQSVGTWRREVDRLGDGLRSEEVSDAHLVAYSFGGRLGWSLLERAPALFARATLIGAHPGLSTPAEREARRASDAEWIAMLEERGHEDFVQAWEQLPLWDTQRSLPVAELDAQRVVRRSHTASGLASALRRLGLAEMPRADVSQITADVSLLVGERDERHCALAHATGLDVRVAVGVGHNVLLEDLDAVTEAVLA